MARFLLARFAEIDRWQFALRLGCLGQINGGEPAALYRNEGLTRFSTRSSTAT
jgi:hypothetical protein